MGRGSDVFLHRYCDYSLSFLHHGTRTLLSILRTGKKYRELSSHHPSDSRTWWRLDQLGYGIDVQYITCWLTPESPPGPLLWHFEENTTNDPSIELDLEEVKTLAANIGFEIKVRHLIPVVRSITLSILLLDRTNAQSIRHMSITMIQCSGIYITPLSGRPPKSCSFLRGFNGHSVRKCIL